MRNERQKLVEDVTQRTYEMLQVAISDDYVNDIVRELVPDIIEDVETSSAFFDKGCWNNDDIRLAIGRVLSERLKIER